MAQSFDKVKTVYDLNYSLELLDGSLKPLSDFRGKVLLIMNVGSRDKRYSLSHASDISFVHTLYQKRSEWQKKKLRGTMPPGAKVPVVPNALEIILFPCDDFGCEPLQDASLRIFTAGSGKTSHGLKQHITEAEFTDFNLDCMCADITPDCDVELRNFWGTMAQHCWISKKVRAGRNFRGQKKRSKSELEAWKGLNVDPLLRYLSTKLRYDPLFCGPCAKKGFRWNFCKFLVGRDGVPARRFEATVGCVNIEGSGYIKQLVDKKTDDSEDSKKE